MKINNNRPEPGMTRDGPPPTTSRAPARALAFVLGLGLLGALQPACADASLPAMNSYGQPPFVPVGTERAPGLAKTFVELLNKAIDGPPEFQLDNLPRRRLELTLGSPSFAGVALFLAPEFLQPALQQRAVWSDPVMVDENLVVSLRPLKLSTLDDLQGMKLGGIQGHIYRALDPLIETGRLRREDAPDHISNLGKLCLGRVDVVIISRSELAGTRPHVVCAEELRPSAFPEPQVIVRRILVRMPSEAGAREVLDAVAAVSCGPQWTQALAQYGLSTAGCRNTLARSNDAAPAKPRKARPTARPDAPPG